MCYNEIRFSITLIIILKNLKNWDHILDIFPKETEKLVEAIYTQEQDIIGLHFFVILLIKELGR